MDEPLDRRESLCIGERAILQRAPLRYRVEELASRLEALSGRSAGSDG